MTDIAPEELDAIHQRVRQTSLTKEQVFRLWKCAIKDDDNLIDEMIQQIYEHIIAFDCQRAECVIELRFVHSAPCYGICGWSTPLSGCSINGRRRRILDAGVGDAHMRGATLTGILGKFIVAALRGGAGAS